MDWNKCSLCKQIPQKNFDVHKDADPWNATICYNIRQFYELECIPVNIKYLASLEENVDLTQLFRGNQAKWHKSCWDKFSNQKLERTEKRIKVRTNGCRCYNGVHSLRLKTMPQLAMSHKVGREVVRVFTEDVASFIRKGSDNYDNETMIIFKAANNIIRQDLLIMEKSHFDGEFVRDCQENSVPQSLRSLVGMILGRTPCDT